MMLILSIAYMFISMLMINSIEIPFISNVILKGGYSSNSTLIMNKTCNECLCLSSFLYPAIKCFSNETCQLFYTFPPTYRIEMMANARLYFFQNVFPNPNKCCMPDINYLLNQLNSAILTSINISAPRDVIIDDNGYLVTVAMLNNRLIRLNPMNLTIISNTSIQTNPSMTIGYNSGAYYVASNNNYFMSAIDSNNLTTLNNITLTGVNGPRAIMFLNNGQTIVITSNVNKSLVFFSRSSHESTIYRFAYNLVVSYNGPHGLWRVNDSFFYVTARGDQAIYSHSYNNISSSWTEKFVFNVSQITNTSAPDHVTIDECGRFWITLGISTILIYDQLGDLLGNFTIPDAQIFDIKIMDNYLMYLSDWDTNKIFRLEPNIQC